MSELTPADLAILLVEPSTTQQKIIINLLNSENVTHIKIADSVESAIASIKLSAPDLVASAMHFTDGTALDLVKLLKNDPMTEDVPFMLVSSEHRKEQLEEFRQSGVVAILPKPFTHDHLAKAIHSTLDLLSESELDLESFDVHEIRVLVVDDSKMARNFVSRVLRSLGIERITEATDGSEAVEMTEEEAEAEFYAVVEELGWTRNGRGDMGAWADIDIPSGFRFTERKGSQQLMEMFGIISRNVNRV